MALTCVSVVFEIGHEAVVRNKKTAEGFTHDWELFVRGAENTDIHHFVDKVVFHLHETFHNPKRVIKEPPYVVRESGYAGFSLYVEIYLKNKPEPNKIRYKYQLILQEKGPPISNVVREKHVFNNPPEDFRRKLIKGGGVGVGAESTSGGHTSHMATHTSENEHKNSVNKNKSSPQDINAIKKSKKENIPKNEEKLNENDPFSLFGQPINTSKIPFVSKSTSKQISDKISQQDKQGHSSKPSKHNTSSHKEKEKDKERDKDKDKEREKEKDKVKDREKEKDKNQTKKIKDENMKKEKSKDEKNKILKSSKEDSKKNSYHEEKSKEKMMDKTEKDIKLERKDKEKKHKEDKKQKSKEKHRNTDKKENIDIKENYNKRSEKVVLTKDENLNKDEKKMHKITEDKEDKVEKVKEKPVEPKNVYSNGSVNNNVNSQPIINSSVDNIKKEEKHRHHKHKKDKSKKDNKRDKEEKKDKLKESKEIKEKPISTPVEPPKSASKSDTLSRKRPLNRLFDELSKDSDTSDLDEEPVYSNKIPCKEPSPEITNSSKDDSSLCVKQKESIKEEKIEASKKKSKKSSDDKESKKRKRKSKEKIETPAKIGKYENRPTENDVKLEVQEPASESRHNSLSPSVSENIFTDEYITKLKELQRKIMTLDDNSGLQRIVQVVAETGQYEITTRTFDFDLCSLDKSIVDRLFEVLF